MKNCLEKILEDVIRIDVYHQSEITLSIPFNAVPVIEESISIASGVSPVLSVALSQSDDINAVMESSPKLQITDKRDGAAMPRNVTIDATIIDGFDTVQSAVDSVIDDDITVLLTAYDNTQYIICAFPNTSSLSLTDNRQQAHTATLKFTAQSLSGLIKVLQN